MDAGHLGTVGVVARDRTEATAALGWLGCGANDPVFLCRGWRTYSESGETPDQHHNYWLHDTDNFCGAGLCAQNRNQPATLSDGAGHKLLVENRLDERHGQLSLSC